MSLREEALNYARQGMRVFPCEAGGKAPLTPHGFKDATSHREVIRDWWGEFPNANIGYAIPEGIVVVDVDPRNGAPFLADLTGPTYLPITRTASTPGGGWHLYYTVPEDVNLVGKHPFLPGIDIKAAGKGYVLLPPSVVGPAQYVWQWWDDMVPLPEGQLALLTRKAPTLAGDAVVTRRAFFPWESGSRYGLGVLRKRVEQVRGAPEGCRNNTLFKAVAQVAQFIAGGELDEDYALGELLQAALDSGLDVHEAIPTIRSAYEVGVADPRSKA